MESSSSPLQREIRQKTPFQSKGEEAVLGLLRTADLVHRLIARVLEPYDATPQQYNVLRILRGAGSEGIPTLAIRERMLEQTPGITRLLDRLEAKGWAERRRCSGDRRQVLCFLTASGADLLAELDEPMSRLDRDTVGVALSTEQLFELVRLLDSIRAAHEPQSEQVTESKGDKCNE